MDHVYVQYPGSDEVVCQSCGLGPEVGAEGLCFGPSGEEPTPPPDLS